MEQDLQKACSLLEKENYTCVLCKGQIVYTSTLRGVAPLLQLLDEKQDAAGFSAADKVVGRATAYLYCLLGVKAVYARVISRGALEVLEQAGIDLHYDTLVEQIRNRTQTGPCPMELATKDVNTPEEALLAVRETLTRLRNQ